MDLFKLLGTIAIDSSGAKKELDKVGEKGGQAESKLSSAFSKIGNGALALGKAVGTGMIACGTAIAGLVTASVNAYADYEQLVGGIDTLFGDSSAKVQEYAKNAYKTAGMSANEYMETVTGFSASLLQSLGGDTEKATEMSNMALTDMSDNANKMGSDMESIKNAYSGFAKQNYTMLDNLKLGYGGTKEEMQRLLEDAEKFSGIEYDISSYADVVDAIHVIQTEMGITGTTAKESASTISGSIASMKGSWQNLLTAISSDELPFDEYVNNFVDSVSTVADNLMPRIQIALNGVVSLIDQLAPVIIDKIPGIFSTLLPSIITGATSLLNSLVSILPSLMNMLTTSVLPLLITGFVTIFNSLVTMLPTLVESIASALPTLIPLLVDGLVSMILTLCTNLPLILQPIIDNLPSIIISIVTAITENLPVLIEGLITLMMALVEATPIIIQTLVDSLPTILQLILDALILNLPLIIQGLIQVVGSIVQSIPTIFSSLISAIGTIFSSIWDAIKGIFAPVIDWFKEKFGQAWAKIKEAFQPAIDWFKGIWDGIVEKFHMVIDPWIEIFQRLFQKVKDFVVPIIESIKTAFANAWNKIKEAFQPAINFFTGIWNGIKNAFSKVTTWFKDIFSQAWQKVKDVFSTGGKIFDGIKEGIANVFKTVVNGIIGGINKVIKVPFDAINTALTKIKGISILDIKPFDWIRTISVPQIPLLETGGVLKKGQTGFLEGNGDEAVVPLERNTGWISEVAHKIVDFAKPSIFDYNPSKGGFVNDYEKDTEVIYGEISAISIMLEKLLAILDEYFPQVVQLQVAGHDIVVDGRRVSKVLAKPMNEELGRLSDKEERGG